MLNNVDLFFLAAWNGDIQGVRNYIDQGGDINVKHKVSGTIYFCILCGRVVVLHDRYDQICSKYY